MFIVLASIVSCEQYPLIVGVKPNFQVSSPADLMNDQALGTRHCCFIIENFPNEPFKTVKQLGDFANAMNVCESKGILKTFNTLESDEFNFLNKLRNHYKRKMNLISYSECICKLERFWEGLLTVRVTASNTHMIEEVLQKIPQDVTVSFICATENLFIQ